MNTFLPILQKKRSLTEDEAYVLQSQILMGHHTADELVSLFELLATVPLTYSMLYGFYLASLQVMKPFDCPREAIDIVGTGGDGKATPNISTLAAIVCSYLGVQVAKHGNRSASGICGSADVLEACGVQIMMSPSTASRCLEQTNFTFLFAPLYHPAFAHARAARAQYGKPTYFNILGPLLHPGRVGRRLIGVADVSMIPLMSEVLTEEGVDALFVHGYGGMDELSIEGKNSTYRNDAALGRLAQQEVDPDLCGIRCVVSPRVSSRQDAIHLFTQVLKGTAPKELNEMVALNAAYAISPQAASVTTICDHMQAVQKALVSGNVYDHLQRIARISHT